MYKESEFPQVQYIDLSEVVHVVKAVIIVTCALCGQSRFESRGVP